MYIATPVASSISAKPVRITFVLLVKGHLSAVAARPIAALVACRHPAICARNTFARAALVTMELAPMRRATFVARLVAGLVVKNALKKVAT